MDRDNVLLPPKTLIWFFEVEYINDLPWDHGKSHWTIMPPLGDAPSFWGILPKDDTFLILGEK